MTSKLKVIIIGGGIGGLTFARACLDVGMEVELYEKRNLDLMLSGPGGIFLQTNAMRVYKLLYEGKIYQRLYEQGGKILEGGFFSQKGEPLYTTAPHFVGEDDLGVCLLRPELQQILYESLPAGIVRNDREFDSFEQKKDKVKVYFQDGSETSGDILVGADGIYSKVRAYLNHQERLEEAIYSGMSCWRGFFHGGNLRLDPKYSWVEYWGKSTRFGYFDVGGGRFSFYGFKNAEAGGNDDVLGGSWEVLRSLFSSYAEPIPAIIETLKTEKIYRDDIFDRQPLGSQWGRGRVTLIGDAAHPVQPNLGQGGCMAIEDAFELVKLLKFSAATGEDLALTLRQFESSRNQRVAKVFTVSRQVGKLGQTDTSFGCFLRNWIYKLTPTKLADLQFRWLFDYQAKWGD